MPDVPPSALEEEPGPVDQAIVVEHDDDNDNDNNDNDDNDDNDDDDDEAVSERLPPEEKIRLNNLRIKRMELMDLLELHNDTAVFLQELEHAITGRE